MYLIEGIIKNWILYGNGYLDETCRAMMKVNIMQSNACEGEVKVEVGAEMKVEVEMGAEVKGA